MITKSESIKEISAALVQFHSLVGKISKDAENPFFKSEYASLSQILDAIKEPLVKTGLVFCQFPVNGNQLTTILMHSPSGEFIMGTSEMKPTKDDPQGQGSAITYQRRYTLSAILGLNIENEPSDDDGNLASGLSQAPKILLEPTPTLPMAPTAPSVKPSNSITEKQRNMVFAISKQHNMTEEQVKEAINWAFGVDSLNDLTMKQASSLINAILKNDLNVLVNG